jgi:putative molybdopterin biosynthesis protein
MYKCDRKMESNFYTVEEVSKKLKITKLSIYRYIKSGKLKAYRIGKNIRISEENLNKFIINLN